MKNIFAVATILAFCLVVCGCTDEQIANARWWEKKDDNAESNQPSEKRSAPISKNAN